MNSCVFHPDVTAAAYCRTCGKGLCQSCVRGVRGVVYCEDCLAQRLQDTMPPVTAAAPTVMMPPTQGGGIVGGPTGTVLPPGTQMMVPASGPNPVVAAILAGFFPFGVGPVYAGQYAKGLAHFAVFTGIILILSQEPGTLLSVALGLMMGFYYFYQIIDAYRTAKAVQLGQPVPDPFGLAQTFTGGDKVDVKKIPMSAIILIGLGGLFLLDTMGIHLHFIGRLWPLILIGIGLWLFVRRSGAYQR